MSSTGFITYRGTDKAMLRYLPILMLVVLRPGVPAEDGRAVGHRGTRRRQQACRPDVLRHCGDKQEQDDYAIADCLKAHERQLSSACHQALKEGGG